MKKVAQLQQILFILFTIFGFILCILSIALRADMWFKDEWSSFILGTYVPYIISTCLCALIFVKESGKGGLRYDVKRCHNVLVINCLFRCFICRLANDNLCEDIDPLAINSYPSSFPWLTMVLLSYALKLLDCFIIGGTTLTFGMFLIACLVIDQSQLDQLKLVNFKNQIIPICHCWWDKQYLFKT